MEQNPPYFSISQLVKMAKPNTSPKLSACDQTLALIDETFRAIDDMTIEEREVVFRHLTGWMLVEKFEFKGQSALAGIKRYCLASCLSEDPNWSPPMESMTSGLISDRH